MLEVYFWIAVLNVPLWTILIVIADKKNEFFGEDIYKDIFIIVLVSALWIVFIPMVIGKVIKDKFK